MLDRQKMQGKFCKPKDVHSFRASTTSFNRFRGRAMDTASRCRQAIPIAAYLPLRAEQAMRNGSIKCDRRARSVRTIRTFKLCAE